MCQAQCQVQAQLLPLASPASARTSPPAYPRPRANSYLPRPAPWSTYWRPQRSPPNLRSPETAPGSFLLMSPRTPSSKTLPWDVPPNPSRELNSATHQTGTRPLSPPIPPHHPLLHNHFRFRDGHLQSHRGPPPPQEKGRGRSRALGARQLQRRETHPAATAAAAPEPEPERGRGGVCWGGRERVGWEGQEGRAHGGARGTHFRRETDLHTQTRRARARHPQGGGARQWVVPRPP